MDHKPIDPLQWWLHEYRTHKRETENFTLDLSRLGEEDLLRLWFVSSPFLNYAPVILTRLHERHHKEIRRAVAYLNQLNAVQAPAMNRELETIRKELRHGR